MGKKQSSNNNTILFKLVFDEAIGVIILVRKCKIGSSLSLSFVVVVIVIVVAHVDFR